MVPLAIGTQTGGSVIRPAAYCGVVGFKPSFGLFPPAGMHINTESLDTVGMMARSVDDIALFRAAMMAIPYEPPAMPRAAPRLALCRTPHWDDAQPEGKGGARSRGRTARRRRGRADRRANCRRNAPTCSRIQETATAPTRRRATTCPNSTGTRRC